MFKKLFTLFFLGQCSIISALAQNNHTINLDHLLESRYDDLGDISYFYLLPKYEDTPNPSKIVTLEIFSGEIDFEENDDRHRQWLEDFIQKEKRTNPNFRIDSLVTGPNGAGLRDNNNITRFISESGLNLAETIFEDIPPFLSFAQTPEAEGERAPSSISTRLTWSLVRWGVIGGGSAASLIITKDVDPAKAAMLATWTGFASGLMTYFSDTYDRILNRGDVAKWLLRSSNPAARQLRQLFGLTRQNLADGLRRYEAVLSNMYPEGHFSPAETRTLIRELTLENFESNPAVRASVLAKLITRESFVRWYFTEFFFTILAVEIPQSTLGITVGNTLLDTATTSLYATLAQGPYELAIFRRAKIKILDLKRTVESGQRTIENSELLLDEIRRILSESGENKQFNLTSATHPELRAISKWKRSRMTILSLFAVVGTILDVTDTPYGVPFLVSVGISGSIYFAHVENVFRIFNGEQPRFRRLHRYIERLSTAPTNIKNYFTRSCSGFFNRH